MEAAAAAAAQQQEEKLLVEAKSVGEKFLVQYYKCASEENANLHKFYKTNAVCSCDTVTVSGSNKTADKLKLFSGANFDLESPGATCTFQPTAEGGVLIMVSGLVVLRNQQGANRFVQTFLLARKEQRHFFIANDMFRLLGEVEAAAAGHANEATSNGDPAPVPAFASAGESSAEHSAAPEPVVAAEKPMIPPIHDGVKEQQSKPAQAPKAARGANTQQQQQVRPPQQQEAPAPAKPSGPPSYSQVAAKSGNNGSSSNSSTPPVSAAPSFSAASKEPVQQRSAAASPQPQSGMALFVKNVESRTIKKSHLIDAYKAFGTVTSVSFASGTAILTFLDQKEVEAALGAKDVIVEGILLDTELYVGQVKPHGGGGGGGRRGGDAGDAGKSDQQKSSRSRSRNASSNGGAASAPSAASSSGRGGSSRSGGGGSSTGRSSSGGAGGRSRPASGNNNNNSSAGQQPARQAASTAK